MCWVLYKGKQRERSLSEAELRGKIILCNVVVGSARLEGGRQVSGKNPPFT